MRIMPIFFSIGSARIYTQNILRYVEYYTTTILKDLRSYLHTRVTEQQKALESAKSEVEKNILGTTTLEQVSEIQKARLDRQIEQFEELQKVLVKV
jgi:pyruvate-formate lyase